jgi:hypothetical protein
VNVKVPNTDDPPLNGASSRNFAVCSFAPSVKLPLPKFIPLTSVKKKAPRYNCTQVMYRLRLGVPGLRAAQE